MFWTRRWLTADPRRLGRWGERQAERYLRRRGLETLDRNARFRLGEIDLVMVDPEGAIVFVEVKTRLDEEFQPVEAVITQTKRGRLGNAIRCFEAAHHIENRPCRCDVVVVVLGPKGRPQIRHTENGSPSALRPS
jgi:putative endonuclease